MRESADKKYQALTLEHNALRRENRRLIDANRYRIKKEKKQATINVARKKLAADFKQNEFAAKCGTTPINKAH